MSIAYLMALNHLGIKNGVQKNGIAGLGSAETELLRVALKHSGVGAAADFVEGESYSCGMSSTGAYRCVGRTKEVVETFKALQTQVNRVVVALLARDMSVQSWKLPVDGEIGAGTTSTVAKLLASPLIQKTVTPPYLPPLAGSTISPSDVAGVAATLTMYFKQVADTLGASLPLTPAGAPMRTPSPGDTQNPPTGPINIPTGPTSLPAGEGPTMVPSSGGAPRADDLVVTTTPPPKKSKKAWIIGGIVVGVLAVGTTVVLMRRSRRR